MAVLFAASAGEQTFVALEEGVQAGGLQSERVMAPLLTAEWSLGPW